MMFIGNERQLADNDIAIVDARPLSECWSQLSERMESTVGLPDESPGSAEQQRWTKAVCAGEQAARKLRLAISGGQLRILRVHGAQPVPITPRELLLQNIKTGVFKTYERPTADENGISKPPEMQGARLWVKESDWTDYLSNEVPPLTARAENRCRDWLKKQFAAETDCKRTKTEIRGVAIGLFAGLSTRAFNRAWKDLAPPERSKPGRKSSRCFDTPI